VAVVLYRSQYREDPEIFDGVEMKERKRTVAEKMDPSLRPISNHLFL